MTPRIIEIRQGLLKKNDELARGLRKRFRDDHVFVVNLVSSPGSGKTELLELTLRRLAERGLALAALVGDLETDNDARRLQRSGVPVKQIQTHGICHLEATMIEQHLEGWDLHQLDLLFIENVGNLVCTSSFDLGESLRVALLSVTEGEDKPLKYPTLFASADVAIITKIDLVEPCRFDRELALTNLRATQSQIKVFETSARTQAGIEAWIDFLEQQCLWKTARQSGVASEPKTITN